MPSQNDMVEYTQEILLELYERAGFNQIETKKVDKIFYEYKKKPLDALFDASSFLVSDEFRARHFLYDTDGIREFLNYVIQFCQEKVFGE